MDYPDIVKPRRSSHGNALLRTIALTTAIFAAVAAIASLKAGGSANESGWVAGLRFWF